MTEPSTRQTLLDNIKVFCEQNGIGDENVFYTLAKKNGGRGMIKRLRDGKNFGFKIIDELEEYMGIPHYSRDRLIKRIQAYREKHKLSEVVLLLTATGAKTRDTIAKLRKGDDVWLHSLESVEDFMTQNPDGPPPIKPLNMDKHPDGPAR